MYFFWVFSLQFNLQFCHSQISISINEEKQMEKADKTEEKTMRAKLVVERDRNTKKKESQEGRKTNRKKDISFILGQVGPNLGINIFLWHDKVQFVSPFFAPIKFSTFPSLEKNPLDSKRFAFFIPNYKCRRHRFGLEKSIYHLTN